MDIWILFHVYLNGMRVWLQYLCGDGVIKHEQLYTVIRPYFS